MTLQQRIALNRYYRHVAKHGIVGPVEQPIKDYAPAVGKDYAASQAKRPMARRVASQGGPLLIVAAAVALTVAGVLAYAKLA